MSIYDLYRLKLTHLRVSRWNELRLRILLGYSVLDSRAENLLDGSCSNVKVGDFSYVTGLVQDLL